MKTSIPFHFNVYHKLSSIVKLVIIFYEIGSRMTSLCVYYQAPFSTEIKMAEVSGRPSTFEDLTKIKSFKVYGSLK